MTATTDSGAKLVNRCGSIIVLSTKQPMDELQCGQIRRIIAIADYLCHHLI